MAQILHPRAKTTHEIRARIQQSKKTLAELAKEYGLNIKTVFKWKHRTTVEDSRMGTKQLGSTVLTEAEEEFIVRFRKLTQLSLDDIFISLKEEIPRLTRSNLHRCLRRHGVNKLELPEGSSKTKKKVFKEYEIGYLHIDTAEVRCEEGVGYMFVAIDRTAKLAFAKIYRRKTKENACDFLQDVLKKIPYVVNMILTDNGTEFTDIGKNKEQKIKAHIFDRLCQKYKIEHRLTKVKHPWTNGQVERMNRTIKEATVKKYHYVSFDQMQKHLDAFLLAYNIAKPLRALNFKAPIDFLIEKLKIFHYNFKDNPFLYFPKQYS